MGRVAPALLLLLLWVMLLHPEASKCEAAALVDGGDRVSSFRGNDKGGNNYEDDGGKVQGVTTTRRLLMLKKSLTLDYEPAGANPSHDPIKGFKGPPHGFFKGEPLSPNHD